ncbi:hypothetical protein A3709_10655 [Halioglobus sp. HI00S01]|nr:DUF2796 domain-containing protein [Halioglobus sp. HI00S01]KZX51279.1 hypothetical protein A3709_10655 [Halioglobus sp. HI00S01]
MKKNPTQPSYLLTKLVLAMAMLPGLAAAQSENHGAHVHGLAELMVVAEDNTLELEFTSPAMSIAGFEHPASTPEQKANVKKAKEKLNAVSTWLTLEGGGSVR